MNLIVDHSRYQDGTAPDVTGIFVRARCDKPHDATSRYDAVDIAHLTRASLWLWLTSLSLDAARRTVLCILGHEHTNTDGLPREPAEASAHASGGTRTPECTTTLGSMYPGHDGSPSDKPRPPDDRRWRLCGVVRSGNDGLTFFWQLDEPAKNHFDITSRFGTGASSDHLRSCTGTIVHDQHTICPVHDFDEKGMPLR